MTDDIAVAGEQDTTEPTLTPPASWAVVRADGTLARRSQTVTGATRLGPGRYEVTFDSDVSRRAYIATIGDPGNGLVFTPGMVFTAGGHASERGVYVETKNMGGGLTDFPFHLEVTTISESAVVNGPVLVRGSARSVQRLGIGQYEVTFDRDVGAGAFTATIGDPADQLVYNPGLVFTAGGHQGSRGVYVETKNLGGGLTEYPFHLSVSTYVDRHGQSDGRAVVRGDGRLIRGLNVTGVQRLGPGRYQVTFKNDMGQAAYTATIGDPANGLVFSPGLVFTAGGHAGSRGVYVETKNLGGGLTDFPFHLRVSR